MKRKEMISMDYIKEIRKRLGHDPIILCACGCLIFRLYDISWGGKCLNYFL